jgi:hypothetical protein
MERAKRFSGCHEKMLHMEGAKRPLYPLRKVTDF